MSLSNPTGHGRLVAALDSNEAVALYLAGMNCEEIGKRLMVAQDRVRRGLQQAGVWQAPIFKAQHLVARKKCLSVIE